MLYPFAPSHTYYRRHEVTKYSIDPAGYNYTAPNPLDGMNAINPSTVNPFLDFQGAAQGGPDYLQYDIRGRSWTERMFFSCGTMYLLGIGGGGMYGFFEGAARFTIYCAILYGALSLTFTRFRAKDIPKRQV